MIEEEKRVNTRGTNETPVLDAGDFILDNFDNKKLHRTEKGGQVLFNNDIDENHKH
jgi:hypothetical protein